MSLADEGIGFEVSGTSVPKVGSVLSVSIQTVFELCSSPVRRVYG